MRTVLLMLALAPGLAHALDAPDVAITAALAGDSLRVRLDWAPVPGADRYWIYRHDRPGAERAYQSVVAESPWEATLPAAAPPERQGDWSQFFTVVADSLPEEPRGLVLVPAGRFEMGEPGVAEPTHEVTLAHDFLLGRTELTNAVFLEALGWALDQGLVEVSGNYVRQHGVDLLRLGSDYDYYEIVWDAGAQAFALHAGTADLGGWGPGAAWPGGYDPAEHPVVWVSWYGAACCCDWLSAMAGLPPYYNGNWDAVPALQDPYAATGYRLPTEAEWEYAAQFADERLHPWGDGPPDCARANFGLCTPWTGPAGARPAGASQLGLLDLAGNALEWCNDRYGLYYGGAQTDPAGPVAGDFRVMRGGYWAYGASATTCVYRGNFPPAGTYHGIGFRLCRTLP